MPSAKQGLGGHCGLYAPLNGTCTLCPDTDHVELFEHLVRGTDAEKYKKYALQGMGITACHDYVKEACQYAGLENRRHDIKAGSKSALFNKIAKIFEGFREIGSKAVLIIGWDTDLFGHWTCVINITPGANGSFAEEGASLVLADSGAGSARIDYAGALVTNLRRIPRGADALDVRVLCMWTNANQAQARKILKDI